MKTTILAAILMGAIAAAAQTPNTGPPGTTTPQGSLEGVYAVEGTNSDGSSYTGFAEIQRWTEEFYRVQWVVGSERFEAYAFIDGNRLVAAGLHEPMLISYTIKEAILMGKWALPDAQPTRTEILTRTSFKSLDDAAPPQRRIVV